MSKETENQPPHETAAPPFRRRRQGRRRFMRRNESPHAPTGLEEDGGEGKAIQPGGPEILEQDSSPNAQPRRTEAAEFVQATEEAGENRSRPQGGFQNGEEPP